MLPALQTTAPTLLVFAAVGLLGGAHCLGMCGPLVTLYTDRLDSRRATRSNAVSWFELRQHALFNVGRTGSYAVFGALLGAAGATVLDAAALGDAATLVRASIGVLVGVAIVTVGLTYLRGASPRALESVPLLGRVFSRVAGALTARVDRLVDGVGIAGLGAVHGLLPCPLLYPAYLYAFSTGSPLRGFLALAALGLGTIPAVFAYGAVFQSIGVGSRTRIHRVLGGVFVVLGTVPLTRGLRAAGLAVPALPLPMPPIQP